jgi:hypothetical protein
VSLPKWLFLAGVCIILASGVFGQMRVPSTADVPSSPWPPSWVIPPDPGEFKIILRLDTLPDEYRFEFWNNGDVRVITKGQLVRAIAILPDKLGQTPEKFCTLGAQGRILNYPCRVKQGGGTDSSRSGR